MRIFVERSARRVRSLAVHVRHFKGLGVVKRSVASAMANGDRVVPGNLVQIVDCKLLRPSTFTFVSSKKYPSTHVPAGDCAAHGRVTSG